MAMADSLRAYWSCDEESGNRLDPVGGHDLPANNGAGFAAGKHGNALLCDAAAVQCLVGDTTIQPYGKSLTLSAWIYITADQGSKGVAMLQQVTNNGLQFGIVFTSGGNLYARMINTFAFGPKPTLNAWNHIVARYDIVTPRLRLDVNGVLGGETTSVAPLSADIASRVRIGAWNTTVSSYTMTGRVDEVAYFEDYLSDADVAELFNGGDGGTLADIIGGFNPAFYRPTQIIGAGRL